MKRISSQQQLFNCLQTDEQRRNMSASLRHLKPESQELLCIALVAWLRWHVLETFEDEWLQCQFDSMRSYLLAEFVTYKHLNTKTNE